MTRRTEVGQLSENLSLSAQTLMECSEDYEVIARIYSVLNFFEKQTSASSHVVSCQSILSNILMSSPIVNRWLINTRQHLDSLMKQIWVLIALILRCANLSTTKPLHSNSCAKELMAHLVGTLANPFLTFICENSAPWHLTRSQMLMTSISNV